jgi:predicted metal-dependent hydrolase
MSDYQVPYTLKISKRARSIRITVKRDSTVVVSMPRRASIHQVEHFVATKAPWIQKKVSYFVKRLQERPVLPYTGTHAEYQKHKEQARQLITRRIAHFNQFYGYNVGKITIRNQQTRWGSCSRKGNLSFNYKLALLPEYLADYVIVHELCHLGQFNHSQAFWDLVDKAMPNYKLLRKELYALR